MLGGLYRGLLKAFWPSVRGFALFETLRNVSLIGRVLVRLGGALGRPDPILVPKIHLARHGKGSSGGVYASEIKRD